MNKRLLVRTFLAAAAALAFLGCSSAHPSAPQLNPTTGQHPANWLQDHWAQYLANPGACVTCHGSTTNPAAAGGIAQVSCFTCHPQGPNHPTGWAAFSQHGALGAQAAADATPFSMKGMASCTVCHGADYATGVGNTISCYTCHTRAPHPVPWGTTSPLPDPALASRHDQTDPSNARACFQCHEAGSPNNPTGLIITPAITTTPGCMNNTMCHGNNVTALPPA